jgi:DNA primase
VPLNPPVHYEKTTEFAHAVATNLEREFPDLVLSRMQKSLRGGKVFVDWSQNDAHKTTVCAYSLRARERPAVSTPVTWEEVALEHFHKICSGALITLRDAVFLIFGSISAQLQVKFDLRLRQNAAKNQKSSRRTATSFLSML